MVIAVVENCHDMYSGSPPPTSLARAAKLWPSLSTYRSMKHMTAAQQQPSSSPLPSASAPLTTSSLPSPPWGTYRPALFP